MLGADAPGPDDEHVNEDFLLENRTRNEQLLAQVRRGCIYIGFDPARPGPKSMADLPLTRQPTSTPPIEFSHPLQPPRTQMRLASHADFDIGQID
jgi:hypothetical protein